MKHLRQLPDIRIKVSLIRTRDTQQESGEILVRIFIKHRVINRRERTLVKQFGGIKHSRVNLFLESHHRLGRLPDGTEIDHRGRFIGRQRQSLHRDLAHKSQSALRTDKQVRDDVERIAEPDEREYVESGDVLD